MVSQKVSTTISRADLPLAPLEVYRTIREEGGKSFLLESVEGGAKVARYSFIGFDPLFEFQSRGGEVRIDGRRERAEDPYEKLRDLFTGYRGKRPPPRSGLNSARPEPSRGKRPPPRSGLPFSGGLVGYFSYDMVRFFEELPRRISDTLRFPDAHFIIPRQVLAFDHVTRRVFHATCRLGNTGGDTAGWKRMETRLRRDARKTPRETPGDGLRLGRTRPSIQQRDFERSVARAKEYIREGDIFQVVLSRRLEAPYHGNPLGFYEVLRRVNPSPYMFYLDYGETQVAGASPEMLVRLRDGELTLRPIAGTRPRGTTPEEDEKLKVEMLLDEKERAEHLMLVDLGRNDLGRVAEYGSVEVNEFMGVEKYSHVQHLVSNVRARLRPGLDAFQVLRASFPAGTVSGAPKIRAMEIIEELERARRGPYAGGVGYFDFTGNMDFAITIRTLFTRGRRAYLQAGSGIVADSQPAREYRETEHKMGALVESIADLGKGGERR
ncbi:MAG: anthranilate synthase component I [Euryarchaeota archaeon]|nr:anthranilate synthase component I [Euryarchaeota archaeon]